MNKSSSSSSNSITLTRIGVLVAILLAVGAFTRFCNLGQMTYHHDESIHAYYSYKMYHQGLQAWTYDPTYHGQFLYHFGTLFFYLFGDSDFTGRMPFAFVGVLMLGLIWRLRAHVGTPQAVFALALAVASPTLTYFSRFARNDVYVATATLALLVFTLDYLKSRKPTHFLWICATLVWLYTIKENSYVVGAVFCAFLVFYGLWYVVSHPTGSRMRAWHTVVVGYNPLVKLLLFYFWFSSSVLLYVRILLSCEDWSNILDNDLGRAVINSRIDTWLGEHAWFPWTFWGAVFLLACVSFALLSAFRKVLERRFDREEHGHEEEEIEGDRLLAFCQRNLPFAGGMAILFFGFAALFTNLGTASQDSGISTNAAALYDGVIDYVSYWMGQQMHRPRIANLPWYYLPQLALYEFFPLLLSIGAYALYVGRGLGILEAIGLPLMVWSVLRIVFRNLLAKLLERNWVTIQEAVPPSVGSMILGSALLLAAGMVLVIVGRLWPAISRPWDVRDEDDPQDPRKTDTFIPDGVRTFLIYWAIAMVVIYGLLNEKVPWLLTHQALPLVVLGGVLVGDFWRRLGDHWGRKVILACFLVLALPGVRASCLLVFYNSDDPRELMVYTQSHPDIQHVVDLTESAAKQLGRTKFDKNVGITGNNIIAVQDKRSWPLTWYLRHYNTETWTVTNGPKVPLVPIVVAATEDRRKVDRYAGGKYTVTQLIKMSWWPPYGKYWNPYHATNNEYFKNDDSGEKRWEALVRYWKHREVYSPPGAMDMSVYVRKDLLPLVPERAGPVVNVKGPQHAEVIAQWGDPTVFKQPKGVALSLMKPPTLLTVDSGTGSIKEIDGGSGAVIRTIGGANAGQGKLVTEYGGPSGGIVASPDGTIYVADTWGHRVVAYNSEGQFINAWNAGPKEKPFHGPRGIAQDKQGNLYVCDTGKHRVVKFRPNGDFVLEFGSQGDGLVNLHEPVGIACAGNQLYICDVGNRAVKVFTTEGRPVRQIHVPGWDPRHDGAIKTWLEPFVAVLPDGRIVISDSEDEQLYIFDRNGKNPRSLGKGLFKRPKGITLGLDDTLYVADAEKKQVIAVQLR